MGKIFPFLFYSPGKLKVSSLSDIFLSLFRVLFLEYGIVAKTKEHLEAFSFWWWIWVMGKLTCTFWIYAVGGGGAGGIISFCKKLASNSWWPSCISLPHADFVGITQYTNFDLNLPKWCLRSIHLTHCSKTLAFPFMVANLTNDKWNCFYYSNLNFPKVF